MTIHKKEYHPCPASNSQTRINKVFIVTQLQRRTPAIEHAMLLREMSSLGFAGFAETAFERQAQSLGLTPTQWKDSPALRAWAQRHCDVHFVPEKLLSAWGLTPDVIIAERSSRKQCD